MLGYEASDQEVNNSQCYIWVEVQCIDTKGIAISLGTFNLTQNFNGEDQTCTFNPLNHQAFLLALNSFLFLLLQVHPTAFPSFLS